MDKEAIPPELAALVEGYQALARSCDYCGTTKGRIVLEHIVPKARGGSDGAENLASACDPCNSRKGAQLGWVTLDGRTGAYDPRTGPLPLRKRGRNRRVSSDNPFEDNAGEGFL